MAVKRMQWLACDGVELAQWRLSSCEGCRVHTVVLSSHDGCWAYQCCPAHVMVLSLHNDGRAHAKFVKLCGGVELMVGNVVRWLSTSCDGVELTQWWLSWCKGCQACAMVLSSHDGCWARAMVVIVKLARWLLSSHNCTCAMAMFVLYSTCDGVWGVWHNRQVLHWELTHAHVCLWTDNGISLGVPVFT